MIAHDTPALTRPLRLQNMISAGEGVEAGGPARFRGCSCVLTAPAPLDPKLHCTSFSHLISAVLRRNIDH